VEAILEAESDRLHSRPWNRLEKGIRIQKVREWCRELNKEIYNPELLKKTETLLISLIKEGELNSTSCVEYNKDTHKITSIPIILWIYKDSPTENSTEVDDIKKPIDVVVKQGDKRLKRKPKNIRLISPASSKTFNNTDNTDQ
jgi:hypothetical protein